MVQLVWSPGCPHAERTRVALRAAFAELGWEPLFEEVDSSDPNNPADLRAWGSPTILVDGVDVAGGAPSGQSCRIYAGGSPSVTTIVEALRRSRSTSRHP